MKYNNANNIIIKYLNEIYLTYILAKYVDNMMETVNTFFFMHANLYITNQA